MVDCKGNFEFASREVTVPLESSATPAPSIPPTITSRFSFHFRRKDQSITETFFSDAHYESRRYMS